MPEPEAMAVNVRLALGVVAAFSVLVLCMGYAGWFVILLPIAALGAAMVVKDADNSGLGICVLLCISFCYYF